jgi:hypothetical protein
MLHDIINEDQWTEFSSINLWHRDLLDLRKMSGISNTKEIYDKYYNYTSWFIHGNRWAVRESVFYTCVNPLHRLHRIAKLKNLYLSTVLVDSVDLVNKILDCLSIAYPKFEQRITIPT